MINIVALATSFYSMQVYDRVIPASATQTLLVLTLGVLFAIILSILVFLCMKYQDISQEPMMPGNYFDTV